MLIHQSVFRTLASGNLISSDLGWPEAGLPDNTNSFITGELSPRSVSGSASGIMHLIGAAYVDAAPTAEPGPRRSPLEVDVKF